MKESVMGQTRLSISLRFMNESQCSFLFEHVFHARINAVKGFTSFDHTFDRFHILHPAAEPAAIALNVNEAIASPPINTGIILPPLQQIQ